MTIDAQLTEAAALASAGSYPGVDDLAAALYRGWYLQWSPGSASVAGPLCPADLDLPAALRAAHAGSERFVAGWRARLVSTRGRVEARRDGRTRLLDRCDYLVPARPGLRAEPGDELLVADRDDQVTDDGFWATFMGGFDPRSRGVVVRVYWRVGPARAPALVRRFTQVLGDAGVPAALKVVTQSEAFARADAAVLYLPREAAGRVAGELRTAAAALAPWLSDPPPRLTRRLARGVGVAESRSPGPSFGQSRCRLIAEALFEVGAAGPGLGAAERVEAIRARFAVASLDPDRPHLEPGGSDLDDR